MTYPPPAGVNLQRLRPYLVDALRHQKTERAALAIADRLNRNMWRAIAQFDVIGDDLDEVDLGSYSILIEVETSDGWAEFCTVHWTQLGMEWADVEKAWRRSCASTARASSRAAPTTLAAGTSPAPRCIA